MELSDLQEGKPGGSGESALVTLVDGLLRCQDQDGAYGVGCTRIRHRHHVCEHYLSGFFSAGPPSARVAPLTLPWGKTFRSEPAARFALSCVALTAVLRAGRMTDSLRRHLDSLRALRTEWERWGEYLPPDLAFSSLGCLASSPTHVDEADYLLELFADRLTEAGWDSVDLWHALAALHWSRERPMGRILLQRVEPLVNRRIIHRGRGRIAVERAILALRLWSEVGTCALD